MLTTGRNYCSEYSGYYRSVWAKACTCMSVIFSGSCFSCVRTQLNAVVPRNAGPVDDLEFNMHFDPITAKQIKDVLRAKDRAVQVVLCVLAKQASTRLCCL